MHKKKILFLASWYPSKVHPTLGNFVQKHAEAAHEVAEVDVLYAVSSTSVSQIRVEQKRIKGVNTHIVYYPKTDTEIPVFSAFKKKSAYFKALKEGWRTIGKKYDLVHLNIAFPAGIFAKWLKKEHQIPFVITEQWTGFLGSHGGFSSLPFPIRRVYKKIFKDAKQVYPVSSHLGKALQSLKLVDDYKVLYNVVNNQYFYPTKEKREGLPLRFLHVSTFNEEHKNISGMLNIFRQLKTEFTLHLITEGKEEEVWKRLKASKIPKKNCIVETQRNPQEIGEAMRKADCFVLFSNRETFSVVMAEAWTSGIPIIYSQCGGLTEIKDARLGVQVQKREEKALLNAIQYFDPSNYSKEYIREFSLQFSKEKIKERLNTFYEKV